MRRKIAFASLILAFFAPAIVIFGAPAMRRPIRDNRGFVRMRIASDEIIVKFKQTAAAALEEKTSSGFAAAQLELPGSPDNIGQDYPASGNTVEDSGGGISNYEHTKPTLTNFTFAINSAPNGNALVCDSNDGQHPSYLQLTKCILCDGGDE